MKLSTEPFEKIVSGKKIIESRLYDEKRQKIAIGDRIEFTRSDDPNKKILTEVIALYRSTSFNDLFSNFPPSHFGGTSKDDLLKEIEIFYSKEDQQISGVIGIRIEVLK